MWQLKKIPPKPFTDARSCVSLVWLLTITGAESDSQGSAETGCMLKGLQFSCGQSQAADCSETLFHGLGFSCLEWKQLALGLWKRSCWHLGKNLYASVCEILHVPFLLPGGLSEWAELWEFLDWVTIFVTEPLWSHFSSHLQNHPVFQGEKISACQFWPF